MQVSKDFGDEKVSLRLYVSCLKIMVGMSKLVKIFSIGKGKRDLTRMASESARSNQVKTKKLTEIPSGKAFSNLSTSEIIKFLGGNYILSKDRADDLFWEAVWPRLLARGWHSEQPNDHQVYEQGFKNSLVFLFPGVKKFSRRKLVKGEHYFDSVPDFLNKIAKEPKLIELDVKDDVCEKNSEEKDRPLKPVQSYSQPRKPKCHADAIMFTIVDTSFCGGKVRELEGLPFGLSNFTSLDSTEDTFDDVSEESSDMETTRPKRKLKSIEENGDVKLLYNKSNVMKTMVSHESKQAKKQSKSFERKKLKETYVGPLNKRSRHPTESGPTQRLENGMRSCTSSIPEVNEASSSEGSLDESYGKNLALGPTPATKTQLTIDLNVTPEVENGFPVTDSKTRQNELKMEEDGCLSNALAIVNSRRQSTRNQTPTAKALEAVANGFLTVERKKRKSNYISLSEEPTLRPLQRARKGRVPKKFTRKPETFFNGEGQ